MRGSKGSRHNNDYRKLQNILKDLRELRRELCPDEKEKAQDEEMKSFDDFQRKKHELNSLLKDIRVDVDRLNEMRKHLGSDGRDPNSIRLSSENNDRLRRATELFTQLKQIQQKDEKKKSGKKKVSEKELADRREMVMLIGQEIVNLTNENARNKIQESDEEAAMRSRVEQRRREQEERTRARREAAKDRRKRRNQREKDIDEDDFKDIGPKSEQEQAFEAQVQINQEEQDKILAVISRGLDDLKDLANEANKQLTVQAAMLEQVDQKMDTTIHNFKAANKRLKAILDESGGMSRWCPMIICAIILLALVGYIFGLV